jgi:TrmH family RNA methyltransferase
LSDDPVVAKARAAGATIHVVGWQIVKAISDSVTPQGMVAVLGSPLKALSDVQNTNGLVLVLAGVSDPGNVGTLIRTAAAAGADAVVLTEGSTDPLNPKTVRASAAALFATTIVTDVTLGVALKALAALGYRLVGADSGVDASLYEQDLAAPTALVLGNESWGLADSQSEGLDAVVSIPMPGRMESLNVATAGSVIVFELLRQRRTDHAPTVSSGSKEG